MIADPLRVNDHYPNEYARGHWLDALFPKHPAELTLGLSSATAAFYGLLLKQAACTPEGAAQVDTMSHAVFHEMGRMKTREAQAKISLADRDCRSVAIVLVSAIFTASPEYTFKFETYHADLTVLRLTGVDRYYRIAKQLGIERWLTWPTLMPFFEGIAVELRSACRVSTVVHRLDHDGACDYSFTFALA